MPVSNSGQSDNECPEIEQIQPVRKYSCTDSNTKTHTVRMYRHTAYRRFLSADRTMSHDPTWWPPPKAGNYDTIHKLLTRYNQKGQIPFGKNSPLHDLIIMVMWKSRMAVDVSHIGIRHK